jgi:hypothetical protein
VDPSKTLRRTAFIALAAFMLLGPIWPTLTQNRFCWIHPWWVYRDAGIGNCAVKLEVADASGAVHRMPVVAALKLTGRPVSKPIRLRTYEAFDLARAVETNLPAGSKLKIEVREAQREGWVVRHDKFHKKESP